MTDYEELLASAASGLPGQGGMAMAIGAAASAFEAIRRTADAQAGTGTGTGLFAAWMMTAAEAADGRDALTPAATAQRALPRSGPRLAPGQAGGVARALTRLLTVIAAGAGHPADAAACERAAACARRIGELLAQDTT